MQRILHTMIRVVDLEQSIDFYTSVLGMRVLRQKDYPEGRFTLVFVGYDDEDKQSCIELTYNWDQDNYKLGDAFGHIAIAVDDIYAACAKIAEKGGIVKREPGPMKHGTTVIAFIQDPNGYLIELIESK